MGSGRAAQEGWNICILLADSLVVRQKPTQHSKAIIFQLKKNARMGFSKHESVPVHSLLKGMTQWLLTLLRVKCKRTIFFLYLLLIIFISITYFMPLLIRDYQNRW